jgi:hypothetical protein
MKPDIKTYHNQLTGEDKEICDTLHDIISSNLEGAESKVWHGHPVWFLDGNPIVGYGKLKNDVQVLFWSGQSFDEPGLSNEGSFKAAQLRFTSKDQINASDLERYLEKASKIQWDYKNIVKRRGVLERLK